MGSILYAKKVKIHVNMIAIITLTGSVKVFESDLSAWLHVHDFVKIVIEYGLIQGEIFNSILFIVYKHGSLLYALIFPF